MLVRPVYIGLYRTICTFFIWNVISHTKDVPEMKYVLLKCISLCLAASGILCFAKRSYSLALYKVLYHTKECCVLLRE